MVRTLKDDMATDFVDVFMNPDEFAEREGVTYYPADGGAPRSIGARITHEERFVTDAPIEYQLEEIVVTVGRDESNATIGGVATPRRGDRLKRAIAIDPEQRFFTFTGEILSGSLPHCWRLRFQRPKLSVIGTEHRRRT
jgi:hypothetical protein